MVSLLDMLRDLLESKVASVTQLVVLTLQRVVRPAELGRPAMRCLSDNQGTPVG